MKFIDCGYWKCHVVSPVHLSVNLILFVANDAIKLNLFDFLM